MHPALVPLLGPAGPAGLTVAAGGILNAPAILSRTQFASTATSLAPDGTSWQAFAAHAPRFAGPPRRLLLEGQRTNGVRNPRAEGAVAGALGGTGALPTHWAQNRSAELALTVIGAVTVDGLPGLRLRLHGTTAPGGGFALIEFETAASIPAAPGQPWVGSLCWRLAAGSLAGVTRSRAQLSGRSAVNAEVAGNLFSATASPGPTLSRVVVAATLTSDATLARVNHGVAWSFAGSSAVDMTLDLCAPQIEQASVASTPILPPVGAPAAATRGPDLVSAPLTTLGVGGSGACTVLWTALHMAPGTSNLAETLLDIHDGTSANRLAVQRPIAAAAIRLLRTTAGAVAATADAPITPTAGTRYGLSINGAGRAALSLNGAAPLVVTGGPTAGLTTLTLGAMFGEVGVLRVIPAVLSDAALQAQVAGLP